MTKHRTIAHGLREQILAGHYHPGTAIPSITELMELHGVARDTVRDAVRLLVDEGLVVARRGVGTVVRETSSADLAYTGVNLKSWAEQTGGADVLTHAAWISADVGVTNSLQLDTGADVVHRVRDYWKGDSIAQSSEQWIPARVARALAGDITGTGDNRPDSDRNLFELMADAGYRVAQVREKVTTRMPRPHEIEHMEIPPGTPVLVTARLSVTALDEPVEALLAVGVGDRVSANYAVPVN